MKALKPKNIRVFSTLLAVLLALPLPWAWLTGFYAWLSPYVMLNSALFLKSFVGLNLLAIVVLGVAFFKGRWFCRYMCPVGEACDRVSRLSRRPRSFLRRIPSLGGWLVLISLFASLAGLPLFILLDPMAIFNGFFSVFADGGQWAVVLSLSGLPLLLGMHLIFPGLWCGKLCPLGGMFDEAHRVKRWWIRRRAKPASPASYTAIGRRLFLAGGTGVLAGLFIPKTLRTQPGTLGTQPGTFRTQPGTLVRPPASLPDPGFSTLCIRCGSCIRACPTDILKHSRARDQASAWMTPEVDFTRGGYCLESCNLCGTVCPSGSISPFSLEAKKSLFMARVEIHSGDCLLSQQKECIHCLQSCPYQAIDLVRIADTLLMEPRVNTESCVGCGACAIICPVDAMEMKAY